MKLILLCTVVNQAFLLTCSTLTWAEEARGTVTANSIWLAEGVEELPGWKMGPFARRADGAILAVDGASAFCSRDEGKSWEEFAVFEDAKRFQFSNERAIVVTRKGTVIVGFCNSNEKAGWKWDATISDAPDAKLPTYAVRSVDGGRTWQEPVKLHDAWTGAIRDILETRDGRVVFTSMRMQHNPGRHSVLTYSSDDEGATWAPSNVIDLGGVGHHGGVTEATIEELKDGRLWMLLRTNWKVFWQAYSDDGGRHWRTILPSDIEASSAPGLLHRLQDGRLCLIWNRYFPEGKSEYPLSGGDNQWSEVPVSNHREELSIAFSDDEGKSWSDPVVFARRLDKGPKWISYPYVLEAEPGVLWVTTMQGGLRAKARVEAFAGD